MTSRVGLTFRYPHKVEPYAEALRQAGLEPVLIAPDAPLPLDGLSGLVISGGTDVQPALYGAAPHDQNESPDTERDAMEAGLLREALDQDLPVLAICRGMQLFNVVHGGTLIQHLESSDIHRVRGNDPAAPVHEIRVAPGSLLATIFGAGLHTVNSRHHQAVDQVGAGLVITARSTTDGVVEALERPEKRFALGVQWHPEDQAKRDPEQRKLFAALGEAMRQGVIAPAGGSAR